MWKRAKAHFVHLTTLNYFYCISSVKTKYWHQKFHVAWGIVVERHNKTKVCTQCRTCKTCMGTLPQLLYNREIILTNFMCLSTCNQTNLVGVSVLSSAKGACRASGFIFSGFKGNNFANRSFHFRYNMEDLSRKWGKLSWRNYTLPP